MKNEALAKALTTPGFPGLAKACKKDANAIRLAKEYLEIMSRIGTLTVHKMNSSDRIDALKGEKIAAQLRVFAATGDWCNPEMKQPHETLFFFTALFILLPLTLGMFDKSKAQ